MNRSQLRRTSIALAMPLLLVACGGGDPDPVASHPMLSQMSKTTLAGERAVGTPSLTNLSIAIDETALFNWAEVQYPGLFPSGPQNFQLTDAGKTYTVRAYPNGNYLGVGVLDGIVYGLGDFTGGVVTPFGAMTDYTCQVVDCNPPPPSPTGALNECIDHAAATLPTGFRVKLTYEYVGQITGEQTTDSIIDGPGHLFEGQSAVQITTTTAGTNTSTVQSLPYTVTTNTTTRTYEQPGTSGSTWKTLGALIDGTTTTPDVVIPGFPTLPGQSSSFRSEHVYTPPEVNSEFTLQVGQSLTKTETTVSTVYEPIAGGPFTSTSSTTYTFEDKESIQVNGKTYNTCRYKIVEAGGSGATMTWFIVGKGIPAKSTSTSDGQVLTIQLRSGTYNGTPL